MVCPNQMHHWRYKSQLSKSISKRRTALTPSSTAKHVRPCLGYAKHTSSNACVRTLSLAAACLTQLKRTLSSSYKIPVSIPDSNAVRILFWPCSNLERLFLQFYFTLLTGYLFLVIHQSQTTHTLHSRTCALNSNITDLSYQFGPVGA
mgnify:CR=1 FL=1